MYRLKRPQARLALGIVRLIRYQEEQKTRCLQSAHGVERSGYKFELLRREQRLVFARRRIQHIAIDYAIAIEKDRSVPMRLVCSHFISFRLRRGCDTTRCQIIAWKDS